MINRYRKKPALYRPRKHNRDGDPFELVIPRCPVCRGPLIARVLKTGPAFLCLCRPMKKAG